MWAEKGSHPGPQHGEFFPSKGTVLSFFKFRVQPEASHGKALKIGNSTAFRKQHPLDLMEASFMDGYKYAFF